MDIKLHENVFNNSHPASHGEFGLKVVTQDQITVIAAPNARIDNTKGKGLVYVYQMNRMGTNWVLAAVLQSPASAAEGGNFGHDIALTQYGQRILISDWMADSGGVNNAGLVYSFKSHAGTWELEHTIESPNKKASGGFGISISVHDYWLAVGAPREDMAGTSSSGLCHIFALEGTQWNPKYALTSATPKQYGMYGVSVSMQKDEVAVGAQSEDPQGAVHFHKLITGAWRNPYTTIKSMKTSLPLAHERNIGTEVLLDGDQVFIRADHAVQVHHRRGDIWIPAQEIKPEGSTDDFGRSFDVSRDYMVIGDRANDDAVVGDSGAVYAYERRNNYWHLLDKVETPHPVRVGMFGYSVSIAEADIIIGAPSEAFGTSEGVGTVYHASLGARTYAHKYNTGRIFRYEYYEDSQWRHATKLWVNDNGTIKRIYANEEY